MRQASVLITDLDNTLFDWVGQWFYSFDALIRKTHEISGIPYEVLLKDAQKVHQQYHTSEYSFLLAEMDCLKRAYSAEDISTIFDPAIYAFRRERKKHLKLYPEVRETFHKLKQMGVLLVGYTESMAFHSAFRMRRLELDGILDFLFSPPDHEIPANIELGKVRSKPTSDYGLLKTVHRHTPRGELKPNPKLLTDIVAMLGVDKSSVVYVGDSLWKDVMMARDAQVFCGFASYGQRVDSHAYSLLEAVTHWSDEDVQREKAAKELYRSRSSVIAPDFVLEGGFGELMGHVEFHENRY